MGQPDPQRGIGGARADPIRLFGSDLLESLTHVHPATVAAIWGSVAVLCLAWGITRRPEAVSAWALPLAVLGGVTLWTLAEYSLHRFLFHLRPRAPWQERLVFLMHGVHHAQPLVKTRLVMPPAASVPIAGAFYGLFWLILSPALGAPHLLAPLFSGFVAGYLAYDMMHYAIHHVRRVVPRGLRRHHLLHHSQKPVRRYGVSSPLWDVVFGTLPRE